MNSELSYAVRLIPSDLDFSFLVWKFVLFECWMLLGCCSNCKIGFNTFTNKSWTCKQDVNRKKYINTLFIPLSCSKLSRFDLKSLLSFWVTNVLGKYISLFIFLHFCWPGRCGWTGSFILWRMKIIIIVHWVPDGASERRLVIQYSCTHHHPHCSTPSLPLVAIVATPPQRTSNLDLQCILASF